MPADLALIAEPQFILIAWAAGLALVAGYVSWVGKVGSGFTWLSAGSAGLIGLVGVFTSGAWWAWVGLAALVAGLVWARSRAFAGPMLTLAGLGFFIEASLIGGWLPAVTAAVALGGVTGEMMLGHWYLVDPRLPRWILRTLALVGILGLVADGLVLSIVGGLTWRGSGGRVLGAPRDLVRPDGCCNWRLEISRIFGSHGSHRFVLSGCAHHSGISFRRPGACRWAGTIR